MKMILPEIIASGIYNSNNTVKNKTITDNRKTSMFEIEIPMEKGGISYIDSEKSEIKNDVLICAKPGQIRRTKLPFKCYYIHFLLTESDLYNKLMKLPNYLKTNNYRKYYELFQRISAYYKSSVSNDEIILQSLVLELLYNLITESKKQSLKEQMKTVNYDAIRKTLDYIKNNLTGDLSLNTLASIAGFSPTYFHKIFKLSTVKTVRDYVEEQRIKKALDLLVETDLSVTEISYRCGFSSQSYFNYAFKRKMNMTPRQYAKSFYEQYIKSV